MSSRCKNLILLVLCVLIGSAASGQTWPLPAPTPGTEVLCNTPACAGSSSGKKLWPYSPPILAFVGRYADNTRQESWFHPVETARTKWMWFAPDRNRIYTVLGSILFAYDADTFFTRLAGGEPMVPINDLSGLTVESNGAEKVFDADRIFDPKGTWGSYGPDGDGRLWRIDWDDRGNVYIPSAAVGWGIVRDDGGKGGGAMRSIYHTRALEPTLCLVLKTSDGNYKLLFGDASGIYLTDVSDPANPPAAARTNIPPFEDYAKSSDGKRVAVSNSAAGTVRIYATDTLARGGGPIAQFADGYHNVATDGTNFFSALLDPGYRPSIVVFSPNASGSYTKTIHTFPSIKSDGSGSPLRIPIFTNPGAGGFITMITNEGSAHGGLNLRLFKLTNLVPSEVPLDGYVAKHYAKGGAPAGYVNPGTFSDLREAHVFRRGAKFYLLIGDYGLGDVYELNPGEAITARVKSPSASGPFFGDAIKFTSDYSGTVPPSVIWDFGDNVIQTVTPGTSGAPDITHQYGGLTAANLPMTLTVSARNAADVSMNHSIRLTLARPQPRVGVLNTDILFTGATTDLTLPIVSSDVLYDGSDGAVEGHYSEWRLSTDAASTKLLPSQTFGVGTLGERELTFTAHYGPYEPDFRAAADAAFTISPIRYKVRAFAPVVAGPSASGANVSFRSGTRVTAKTADLPNGAATVVEYTWELLNDQNARVGNPLTGNAALSAIPDFPVPRTSLAGAQNWKARLSLKLGTATETALRIPLNTPTPGAIIVEGCANVGTPCSFSVPSASAANDPATWTYRWSVGGGPAAVDGGASPLFAPVFAEAGTYTVTVNVSNVIGDAAPRSATITVGPPLCPSAPSNATTSIAYKGRTTGCGDTFTDCGVGETLDFAINSQGWTQHDCDRYTWNFGDGATSTLRTPAHAYSEPGTYTVTLNVDGGLSDAVGVTRQVRVGSNAIGCPDMVANANVYARYTGASSGCTSFGGECNVDETVMFRPAATNYSYDCGAHTFVWNFGDGTPVVRTTSATQFVPHTYISAGTFPLTLQIINARQTVTAQHDIKVRRSIANSCGTMNPGVNVSIGFTGATSGCNVAGGNCVESESIVFTATTAGYSFACAPHTFEWNFGNGSTSTQQSPAHVFAQPGEYNVALRITRSDNATVTLQRRVVITPNVIKRRSTRH